MRILSFLLIISVSQFMNAQNVFTTYEDTVVYDEFIYDQKNFPQKYNILELSTIENSTYRIKRMSDEGKSVILLNTDRIFDNFHLSIDLEIVNKKLNPSAGIFIHSQANRNGAIFIETNCSREFRAIKQSGENIRLLTGNMKNNGWVKSTNISKSGFNSLAVKTKDGSVDIYINNEIELSIYDSELRQGKVGIFSSPQSEVLIDRFTLSVKKNIIDKAIQKDPKSSDADIETDPAFEEVILIFKTKIDKQQLEIERLNKDLERCKTKLNYDTTLVNQASKFEKQNSILSFKLDSTSTALNRAIKRLEYLESFKQEIENGSNGDLVISLTSILADAKKESKKLKKEVENQKLINTATEKENQILLREVERYKYLLNLKEE